MATSTTIRIQSDDVSPVRVPGVVVQVYQAGGPFVTSGTTDSSGEVNFLLPDTDYDLRFYKLGVSILPKQPQRITVDALQFSNTFQVDAHVRTLPESPDPLRCRVSGFLIGVNGKLTEDGSLGIALVDDVVVVSDNIVLPQHEIIVSPDDQGYLEFDLLRGFTYCGYFILVDKLIGIAPPTLDIVVPNLPAIELSRLLFPIPVDVQLSASAITLPRPAGADSTTVVIITFSDASIRSKPLPPWAKLTPVVADTSIVAAVVIDGTNLLLSPLAPGVTTVTFQRELVTGVKMPGAPVFTSDVLLVTVT